MEYLPGQKSLPFPDPEVIYVHGMRCKAYCVILSSGCAQDHTTDYHRHGEALSLEEACKKASEYRDPSGWSSAYVKLVPEVQ